MQLRGIKALALLNKRLGSPETWPDQSLRLNGEAVKHYGWSCGCTAVTMAVDLVGWDACEDHARTPIEDWPST